MSRKGGADQRLREALAKARAEAPPDPPGRERSRTPPRRGGARQRLDAQLGKGDDAKVTKPNVGDMFKTLLGRYMLANKVSAVDTQARAHVQALMLPLTQTLTQTPIITLTMTRVRLPT